MLHPLASNHVLDSIWDFGLDDILLPVLGFVTIEAFLSRGGGLDAILLTVLGYVTIELCFQQSRLRKSNTKAEKQQLRSEVRLIRKDLKQQEAVAMAAVLKQASIICATLTSASNDGPLKHLDSGHFDLVVIDECSQVSGVL